MVGAQIRSLCNESSRKYLIEWHWRTIEINYYLIVLEIIVNATNVTSLYN
jgi:hypothetical protein